MSSSAPNCGTGTDVGLTNNNLKLGMIADLSGPISGLFQGAEQGMAAFDDYANSTSGGICGHSVSLSFKDGGTNCTQTQNAAQSLAGSAFAFVGTFALYDNCAVSVLQAHPTLPDVHVALNPSAETPANHFDLEPGAAGYATGMFAYFRHKYGSKVQHVGTIGEAIPSVEAKQAAIVHAAESQGWRFVYQTTEQPTNSNFQSDFVKACQQQHIQIFFDITETAQNAATMIQNERQAGCPSSLINIIPIAYDPAFLQAFGGNTSAIEGLQGWNEYSLFFNRDEAQRIPELQLLQSWFARVNGNAPLNLYALFAWADGRLFQQAFENAGATLSRKTVTAALARIKNFTANGIMAPSDPSSKGSGVHCYILWQFTHGQFARVSDPATGYRCDGTYLRM